MTRNPVWRASDNAGGIRAKIERTRQQIERELWQEHRAQRIRELAEYDPTDEPADHLPAPTADCQDRARREYAALALRAAYGDLDICEAEDLRQ